MQEKYNAKTIESNAQKYWHENKSFNVVEDLTKEKFYCLSMFPYPSGKLHMGHVRNYSIGDAISRYQKMLGKNVLQPIGWDAFGLPAENTAIQNKKPPSVWTHDNIKYMKNQLISLGFGYDWSREINTCNPEYYRWEQWLFLRLFKKGLVYQKKSFVNWDPQDKTVLANEQVIDGKGWRSGVMVERKEIKQWFMKITNYAQELLDGLDKLKDWPDSVKTMQKNWIGKSTGMEIDFKTSSNEKITVYTTRPDTIMGATYVAIAMEHPIAKKASKNNKDIEKFINKYKQTKTSEAEIEKMEKVGINSQMYCTHPITGDNIPIWIANFVLISYGSGAVMSVPAHDDRDYGFAKKYNIPILGVVSANGVDVDLSEKAFVEKGILINSGEFNGMNFKKSFDAIEKKLSKHKLGRKKTNYRLKDWGVSRQRYWGCPIPIINCNSCGVVAVKESDLPIKLPEGVVLKHGVSTLKEIASFYKTKCPKCHSDATRETDTFDTFFESSWYFARYACVNNKNTMLDNRANYWLNVDHYIGGVEHAILHLLYARFFNKIMRDEGLIKNNEPFAKLLTQGMVIKDGFKMSKSKGNVVDPQKMIAKYGADTVRLFILFAAPPTQDLEWLESGIEGSFRFIKKFYRLVFDFVEDSKKNKTTVVDINKLNEEQKNIRQKTYSTLKEVSFDMEQKCSFNTVIAKIMKINNDLLKFKNTSAQSMAIKRESIKIMLKMLNPITPHLCHHLWHEIGEKSIIVNALWPKIDEQALVKKEIEIIIQINGKLRGKIIAPINSDEKTLKELYIKNTNVAKFLENKNIVKSIVVPNKLINLVVK